MYYNYVCHSSLTTLYKIQEINLGILCTQTYRKKYHEFSTFISSAQKYMYFSPSFFDSLAISCRTNSRVYSEDSYLQSIEVSLHLWLCF